MLPPPQDTARLLLRPSCVVRKRQRDKLALVRVVKLLLLLFV